MKLKVLQQRKLKLSTALTTVDALLATSIDDQRDAVNQWSTAFPKVLVMGPQEPKKADGVRHVKTKDLPPMANLLRTYMQSIPGADVCLLANPDILINADKLQSILDHVISERMEMAWAAHLNIDGKPRGFIMASPVIAHLVNDLNQATTFQSNWIPLVHTWMQKMMRYRYFDGTAFDLIRPFPQSTGPFFSMAELGQVIKQVQTRKKGPLKRVKVAELVK